MTRVNLKRGSRALCETRSRQIYAEFMRRDFMEIVEMGVVMIAL